MTTLCAIDIGNTNVVLGIWRDSELVHHFRMGSDLGATVDELSATLWVMLQQRGLSYCQLDEAVIGSVVPALTVLFEEMCRRWIGRPPLVVGPGVKTGMSILYDNPREVGADRIVNAIAAYARCQGPCIVVDFGTATTFDVISGKGAYLGGVIVPGIGVSADALFRRAAKLPRVEIVRPRRVIGKATVEAIQAGLVFGYVGLVEGLVARIAAEMAEETRPRVIATGGLARLIASETTCVDEIDEMLTLEGLRLIWERNREEPGLERGPRR
jgi:type III pantothenate kinase